MALAAEKNKYSCAYKEPVSLPHELSHHVSLCTSPARDSSERWLRLSDVTAERISNEAANLQPGQLSSFLSKKKKGCSLILSLSQATVKPGLYYKSNMSFKTLGEGFFFVCCHHLHRE